MLAADATCSPSWARLQGWPQAFHGGSAVWEFSPRRPDTLCTMGIVGCLPSLGNIIAISLATANHPSPVGPRRRYCRS